MNRHEDPGQNMIRHIFGEKFQLNTCLQDDFRHDNVQNCLYLLFT